MVNSDVKSLWLLAVLGMSVLSLSHDPKMVAAEDCDVHLRGLEIECMYYMNKGNPSTLLNPNDRCCKVIKRANVPCVCRNLSRKLSMLLLLSQYSFFHFPSQLFHSYMFTFTHLVIRLKICLIGGKCCTASTTVAGLSLLATIVE
ncbi:hypothetical protein CR513_40170, partial [Mucuna pruriens]